MTFSRSQKSTLQRNIAWMVILSEVSHVFCCVLPTVVTLVSVLASFGAMAQMPVFFLDVHDALHTYEIPIMAFSAAMLVLGWGLYTLSRQSECQKSHCTPHETVCALQKNSALVVLKWASLIFAVNIIVYFSVHVGSENMLHDARTAAHAHDHHHAH